MERLRVIPSVELWYPDGNAVMDSYGEDLLENNRYHHVDITEYVGFKHATLIDVGAYVGVFTYWARCRGVDKAFCFEPCFENYKCLVANQNDLTMGEDCKVFPYALMDHHIDVYHLEGEGQKATIVPACSSSHKSERIVGTTLDEFSACLNIDPEEHVIIKMDIEGSEVEALKGARKFIKTHDKITFILCTYHYQNQFFDVGLILEHILPEISYIGKGEINGNTALMIASNWREF